MNGHDDLDWLAAQQPAPLALAASETRRARFALLAHISGRRAPLAAARPTAPLRRAPERRWIRPSRILALSAVATAAAVAALAIGGGGGGGHVVGVDQAVAAPLVQLSDAVRRRTAPAGDATLVLRRHVFADGTSMTGADLYLDDGTYYYAPARADLPAQMASHATQADGWIARITGAAVAALDLPIEQARTRMAQAVFDPTQTAPRDEADAQRQERLEAAAAKGRRQTPLTKTQQANGWIWTNCHDALVAGGSRPEVRAGVLRLLATIPEVAVSRTTSGGRPALELDAGVHPDGYEEHLVIDAESGLPLRFTGGVPGQTPGVVMTYDVSRVSAAAIAKS